MVNIKHLKQLLNLLQGTDISELEIEENGEKIKIKRGFSEEKPSVCYSERPLNIQKETQTQNSTQEFKLNSEKNGEIKKDLDIKSPFVGTFYRANSPENAPYVEEGSIVKKGDVLCIVEAMKLMNEIESELDGKVTAVLVDNGNPVEYGQSLFHVRPLEN
ncbi:MAG: acetyl-CoA carboxylase biotin carboxyl carrier protein [Deltaproteobacteria bacterium]|nr:acetyl-CoA carboxylase biotin carboxyl carrier protein [Deltaproteobacteria bacterium]